MGAVGLGTDTGNSSRPSATTRRWHSTDHWAVSRTGSSRGIWRRRRGTDARHGCDAAAVLEVLAVQIGHRRPQRASAGQTLRIRYVATGWWRALGSSSRLRARENDRGRAAVRARTDECAAGRDDSGSIAIDRGVPAGASADQGRSKHGGLHRDRVPGADSRRSSNRRFHRRSSSDALGGVRDARSSRDPGCRTRDESRARFRAAVLGAMDERSLDALAIPMWSNPPRLIGDSDSDGDNNKMFARAPAFGYYREMGTCAAILCRGRAALDGSGPRRRWSAGTPTRGAVIAGSRFRAGLGTAGSKRRNDAGIEALLC